MIKPTITQLRYFLTLPSAVLNNAGNGSHRWSLATQKVSFVFLEQPIPLHAHITRKPCTGIPENY